nr:MAG TPA: hypothetical protein [Caudoviricetes sp.]
MGGFLLLFFTYPYKVASSGQSRFVSLAARLW